MRAVMATVPPELLDWRRRTGADRYDEMWNGDLHMAPTPNRDHQELAGHLWNWLREHCTQPGGNRVDPPRNVASVGGWPRDFRIPDVVLLTPDRLELDRNEYIEGPPAVVVEVRSPGDETYEKLSFYAALGVPEVWIVDRDSKQPQVHVLGEGDYTLQPADAHGWTPSPATAVRLRPEGGKLAVQLGDDGGTKRLLPE
ncbi:MAG: Uma2 family endonuclease [Pirellulaceae bacterium]